MRPIPSRLACFALLVPLMGGCSALKPLARHGTTGAVAAGGAAIGLLIGPVGAIVSAGIVSMAWVAIAEAGSLSDGDTMSREQLDLELDRWRNKASSADTAAFWADQRAKDAANRAADATAGMTWYSKLIWWISAGVAIWFAWRNRAHILDFGPGYWKRIWHALVGSSKKRLKELRRDPKEQRT